MIGIIQGRLSKAPKNRLQYFPKKWNLEFKIAKECNYQYIELGFRDNLKTLANV